MNQNNDVNLFSFPSNSIEAIAILYLKNQDLKNKTAIEIQDMYEQTLRELNENWRTNWRSI